jgi:hypothetical protein
MSDLKRFIVAASALAFLSVLWISSAQASTFVGDKMYLDTKVETPAVNDSVMTARLPVKDGTVEFQLFVPAAAGAKTYGYNLEFDNTGNVFTDNFTVTTATDLAGNDLNPNSDGTVEGALLITGATIDSTGLIATFKLTAKQDVPDGTTIKFKAGTTTLADQNYDQDSLDVSTMGVLTFVSGPKSTVDSSAPVIPRDGNVTATVTASGFPAGTELTWTVNITGTATIDVLAGGAMMTGSTFKSTETSIQLKGSGRGAATAMVTASAGTDTTNTVSVVFTEQNPVSLASFGGEQVDDHVVLNWSTASQTNNAGWRVMRSTDGQNYSVVGNFVQGAGTTDALTSYSFEDANPPSVEKVYYRLEQVDLNGAVAQSNAVEVVLGARLTPLPTEFATNVFPNPFNPSTTISYDLPAASQVSIVIYDALGQQVRQLVNTSKDAGRYSVQWDAKDQLGRSVGSGVYIAKIKAGQFSATQKMLLLK